MTTISICGRIWLVESTTSGRSVVWVLRISTAWGGITIVRRAAGTRRRAVPITGVTVVVISAGGALAIVMATGRRSVASGATAVIVCWRSKTTTRRERGAGAATFTRAFFLSLCCLQWGYS
jgi:hypothetical protein